VKLATESRPETTIHCLVPTNQGGIRYVFPLMIFFFIMMIGVLFGSSKGRYALGYVRKLVCCLSEEQYEACLRAKLIHMYEQARIHHERMARLRDYQIRTGRLIMVDGRDRIRPILLDLETNANHIDNNTHNNHRRRVGHLNSRHNDNVDTRDDNAGAENELALSPSNAEFIQLSRQIRSTPSVPVLLRTKRYAINNTTTTTTATELHHLAHSTNHNEAITPDGNVDDMDHWCAICCQNLQCGDRVGDIPCGHVFHVVCLKEWIVRKNHCPLCQQTDLATTTVETRRNQITQNNDDKVDHGTTSRQMGAIEQTQQQQQQRQRQRQSDVSTELELVQINTTN
jgi:hypothetical protein